MKQNKIQIIRKTGQYKNGYLLFIHKHHPHSRLEKGKQADKKWCDQFKKRVVKSLGFVDIFDRCG